MSCGVVDVEEECIFKKERKKGISLRLTVTHSDQSVSNCKRAFPGGWTALDDSGDKHPALQTNTTV